MIRRSIVTRLVAMFALGAALTFTLVGAALYLVLASEMTRYQDGELATNMRELRYSMERFGDAERWPKISAKMETLSPADGSIRFWVLSDDPRFTYGKGLDQIEGISQDVDGHGALVLPPDERTYRILAQRIPPFQDRPAVRVIVGIDTTPFGLTLRKFLLALALLGVLAVVLVMLVGAWIARIGLGPLRRLSAEARALRPVAADAEERRPSRLSQRLNLAQLPVELEDLATAFNGALGRLEAAYRQLEAFNADVAHELRTPLANMIGGTQVALSRQRNAADFQEALQSNLEELERLRSIVNDMLFLARADQGEAATGLAEAGVAHEVRMTIEFFEPLLDETGVTVAVVGELEARATMNVPLFRRALSNLLQNAIDHSEASAHLVVSIARRAEGVWISVSNPGSAIAPEHQPRLFDRFYRVDSARHDVGERHGHGLGLAIVKAVASMHGGTVAAESAGGLTTVAFSVPGA
ncbi:MAG TPA: heavy metal sensor histidine kinase [Burkholderiaceae bacterium]|nr:heavy metal sensor histidine kinase [Burkholderiaceae bacterium]